MGGEVGPEGGEGGVGGLRGDRWGEMKWWVREE